MSDTNENLHRQIVYIAEMVEAATDGELYKVGGDYEIIPDIDEWKEKEYEKKVKEFKDSHGSYDSELYDSYEEYMEDEIGSADDIDEPDSVSLYEYLEEKSLGDIRFEVDIQNEFCGAKMLLAYGGPTIWLRDDRVFGYWWSDERSVPLNENARAELWEYFRDIWKNIK